MKKFLIKNRKFIYGIIIGSLFSSVVVYAATTYLASDIKYKDTTVEAALNDLYNKKNDIGESEYLTNYIASNIVCANCGGDPTTPNINTKGNAVTINMNSSNISQGTTYIAIPDITKYKKLIVKLNGNVKGISVTLNDEIKNKFPYTNLGYQMSLATSAKKIDQTVEFDVSGFTGQKYLIIVGTYFVNLEVTTQGILK